LCHSEGETGEWLVSYNRWKENIFMRRTIQLPLSGWATRDFSIAELETYLATVKPGYFEVSKDLVDGEISIKALKTSVNNAYSNNLVGKVAYAGTTNFCSTSGFEFNEYLEYLRIQWSQAAFLGASVFRVMIGGDSSVSNEIVESRLAQFAELISPMQVGIEIHGGWESTMSAIESILTSTAYGFVIDFQNLIESDLHCQDVRDCIPKERILYFHARNLPGHYIEHNESLAEQLWWCNKYDKPILWEPKKLSKEQILGIYNEY